MIEVGELIRLTYVLFPNKYVEKTEIVLGD